MFVSGLGTLKIVAAHQAGAPAIAKLVGANGLDGSEQRFEVGIMCDFVLFRVDRSKPRLVAIFRISFSL